MTDISSFAGANGLQEYDQRSSPEDLLLPAKSDYRISH